MDDEKFEFKDNIFLRFERKLLSWGCKKEYPAIISFIISIVIPIFGLFFVNNQADLKKYKNGVNGKLMITAILITLLWWGAVFLILIFTVGY